MKLLLVLAMLSAAPDAPTAVVLTPQEAHDEAVRVKTCEKDLADCKASGTVSPMWLAVGIAAGVLSGVAIGFGVGVAWKR